MAAYLKKPFSHNPLVARKPLIRVKYQGISACWIEKCTFNVEIVAIAHIPPFPIPGFWEHINLLLECDMSDGRFRIPAAVAPKTALKSGDKNQRNGGFQPFL